MAEIITNNLTPFAELKIANNLLANLPVDLKNEQTQINFTDRVFVAIKYQKTSLAHKLLKYLLAQLGQYDTTTRDQYEPILVKLQYAAFLTLSLKELVDFFSSYDLTVLLNDELNYDLIGQLKARLCLEPVDERDKWREKIYDALHQNNNLLSQNFIAVGQKGIISNWLREYDSQIGLLPIDSLALAEFHNQAVIRARIDEQERLLLRRFLEFYEYLKLSSSSPAGFEEDLAVSDNGKNYLLLGGEQIELMRAKDEGSSIFNVNIESEQKIEAKITGSKVFLSSLEFSPILTQSRAMLAETNGDIKAILEKLNSAIGISNINQVLAALLLLAQLRRLDDVLADDERLRAIVIEDLKKNNQDAMVEGLRLNPTAPNFLARFLKVVLQDKLKLSEADGLLFAQKLAGLLVLEGEKYGRIVVEDGKGGKKWNL